MRFKNPNEYDDARKLAQRYSYNIQAFEIKDDNQWQRATDSVGTEMTIRHLSR